MTIDELTELLQNQITTLRNMRALADGLGNIEQVLEIEAKIAETSVTLDEITK
jgi:hypothetical protein